MSFISLPNRFISNKPTDAKVIDWGNPLTKNLVFVVLQNEQGDTSLDLCHRLLGEKRNTDQSLSSDPKFGQGYDYDSSTAVVDMGTESRRTIDTSSEKFSGVCLIDYTGASGTIFSKRDGNTVEFQLYLDSSPKEIFFRRVGTFKAVSSTGGLSLGLQIIGFSFDGGTCTSYVNGVNVGNGTGFPTSGREDINLSLGARWNGYPTTAFQFSGSQFGAFIWTGRALSDIEHREIARNPWSLVRPSLTSIFFGTGTVFNQAVSGSITSTGALTSTTTFRESLTGSITATGDLVKQISTTLEGSITATGNVLKKTSKAFSGSITSTGALAAEIVSATAKAVSGSITATGALTIKVMKSLSGSITSSGDITKQTSKQLDGSATPTGQVKKGMSQELSGSITPTGNLTASDPFVQAPDEDTAGSGSFAQRLRRIYGTITRHRR